LLSIHLLQPLGGRGSIDLPEDGDWRACQLLLGHRKL